MRRARRPAAPPTPRVRVLAADGTMIGEMSLAEGLRLALRDGLDLVEVNPSAIPPVCKLMDFDALVRASKKVE